MTGKPKDKHQQIVDHHALNAKYNEVKQNRNPEDTMEARLGRRGVDKMIAKMRKEENKSYMTPANPQENKKAVATPSSPTSVTHRGFEK
jgi:hypothetical protein